MADYRGEIGFDSLKKVLFIVAAITLGVLLFFGIMSIRNDRRRRKKTFWFLHGKAGSGFRKAWTR